MAQRAGPGSVGRGLARLGGACGVEAEEGRDAGGLVPKQPEGRASSEEEGRQEAGVWDSVSAPVILQSRTLPNSLLEAELCGPALQANPGTLAAEIG